MKKIITVFFCLLIAWVNVNAQTKPPVKQNEKKLYVNTISNPGVIKDSILENNPVYFSTSLMYAHGYDGNFGIGLKDNSNTSAVSLINNELLFRKAGLYHFDFYFASEVFGSNARLLPRIVITVYVGNNEYPVVSKLIPLQQISDASNSYITSDQVSMNVFIPANTKVRVHRRFLNANFTSAANVNNKWWLIGHLVQ